MATLLTLRPLVQQRLEETGEGSFWDLPSEIDVLLVEGILESSAISGEVQIRRTPSLGLRQNSTLQDVPDDLIAVSRIENQNGAMLKTSVEELDLMRPNWQNDVGEVPQRWFAFGLTRFGVWPKVTSPANVVLSGIGVPVPAYRPYPTGTTIPFPQEYQEGLVAYAGGIARLKEGGNEMQQGVADYDVFLSQMLALARFAVRKGGLSFTKAMGFNVKPMATEQQ